MIHDARFFRRLFMPAVVTLLSAVCLRAGQAQDVHALEQQAVREAVAAVADSVVQIETLGGLETVGGMLASNAPTTGLVVDSDGWIISSAFNFVQQPASILVTLPGGERKPAKIVARDRSRMLVLLKIETESPLVVPSAIARQQLQVGQTAIAVGRTFDPAQVNLSVGIVSALERIWGKAIQTDANVSPVNYGGPLIDLYGNVIGVLVPLSPESDNELAGNEWYDSGIGFAVPLSEILARLDTLKAGTDLKAGLLGFAFENSQKLDAPPVLGVVKSKSPAASAGLRAGDKLISLNETPILLQSHAQHVLKPLYAGDEVQIVAERAGETIRGRAVLVDQLLPYEHPYLGIQASQVATSGNGPADAQEEGTPRGEAEDQEALKAMVVRRVFANTPAEKAGIQAGDKMIQWNDTPVTDVNQFRTLLASHEPGEKVTVRWQRGIETLSAEVTLDRLPTTVDAPESANSEELAGKGVAGGAKVETGQREWKVPEEPNNGALYIPANYSADQSWGLLTLLGPPGKEDFAKLIEPWKEACAEHHVILFVAHPEDPSRWTPTEVGFVRKAMDQAQRQLAIDPQRVAVLGEEGGGALAFLLAFRNRDLIRGLALDRAAIPFGLGAPENEPLQRLSLLFHTTDDPKIKDRLEASVEVLQRRKFPVIAVPRATRDDPLTVEERHQLARWVETLDRL